METENDLKLLTNPRLESSLGATYCICKDGQSDQALQKTLDYACGAGADCTPILQNGPCFQPNTVKDHCSYAVNSYFQRKGQVQGSCDFSGTAMPSQSPPGIRVFLSFYSSSSSTRLFLLLKLSWVFCFFLFLFTAEASGCVYPSSPRYHFPFLYPLAVFKELISLSTFVNSAFWVLS